MQRDKNINIDKYDHYKQIINDPSFYYKGVRMFAPPDTHSPSIQIICDYVNPGIKILELGAGAGAFTLRLKEAGYEITASDMRPDIFALKDIPFCLIDLDKDIAAEHQRSYDAVVATEVIEHLENSFDFFRKIYSILKPGGLAFISTPNILSIYDRLIFFDSGNLFLFSESRMEVEGHIQVIPSWLLKFAAAKAGFHCEAIYGIGNIMIHVSKGWRKLITKISLIIKKCIQKEKFPGEFQSTCILMVFRKI
jgi:2-polyprenyl-3-methyl-5-hydroxy-6-metoxy-1,4-benzoquinol methylase